MKKNVASQTVGAQMVNATTGAAFTGTVSALVTGDAGTQGAGAGAVTHEGNGYHSYAPTQAETNFDHVAFTFTGTGAVPATAQIYTSFPQTGDNFARLGAPAGASVSADVAAVKAQTAAIEIDTTEIGAAGAGLTNINLPNQTMDIVGNITGNLSGSVGSVTGAVGSVTGAVGSIAAGGIAAASFAAGAIDATAIATGAVDADALATDAVNEIADGILNRDMGTGTDSGSTTVRTMRQALRFLRNKWSISGTTLSVCKEDDLTTSWSSTVTATAGADPITANDPAGP